MTCAQLHDVAAELALGALTGRDRATAIAHLEQCRPCREEVRQLMAVGGLLPEQLPPVEPPAGFETQVLQLLPPGMTGGERPPSMTGGGRGESRQPGRARRTLAATALGLAVVAAALGGWRIVGGQSPSVSSATARLTSARLLSASGSVGSVFLSSGTPRWLYLHVDLGSGDEPVTCQIVGTKGRTSTVGSFRLADGYGTWGSPDPGNVGAVTGARLVSADGVVLATATFPR